MVWFPSRSDVKLEPDYITNITGRHITSKTKSYNSIKSFEERRVIFDLNDIFFDFQIFN